MGRVCLTVGPAGSGRLVALAEGAERQPGSWRSIDAGRRLWLRVGGRQESIERRTYGAVASPPHTHTHTHTLKSSIDPII